MSYQTYKKRKLLALEKAIGSGEADEEILHLLNRINSFPDLVSTSSCSGRVVLLDTPGLPEKGKCCFYRKWHRKVNEKEVDEAVNLHDGDSIIWFRVEPFILHISAKNMSSALSFLDLARSLGIRRGGIQSKGVHAINIEIQGTASMSFPILESVNWKKLIPVANRMVDQNRVMTEHLEAGVGKARDCQTIC